jgi:hypothetical protein
VAAVTRWLVVGPYPPEQGAGAEAARAFVQERVVAGEHVHVVSPRPTAAHQHVPLASFEGLRALWSVARAQGADGIWWRVEPGILLRPGTDRRRGLAERAALVLFLRRFGHRIFDVGDVGLLPGGRTGRPVLRMATELVAHRAADADALVVHGAPPERVTRAVAVDPAAADRVRAPARTTPPAYPPADGLRALPPERHALEAAIRARAQQLEAARSEAFQP